MSSQAARSLGSQPPPAFALRGEPPTPWARHAALALALVALFALASCGRTEPPAPPPARVVARLATAERLPSQVRTELGGSVEAARASTLSSRVMASVVSVEVQLGTAVRAGQTLLRLDPAAAEGAAAQARGGLAQAEAGLALADRNYERYRALAEKRAAAPVELELATTQREQARGAVEQARGALAAARSLAGDARVTAPFAGRVSGRFVEVGDLVAPGRPLVAIESERGRRFVCSVPERLYRSAGLAPGAPVPVRLDARDDLGAIPGWVAEVSPGPDPSTHSYTVKIDLGAAPVSAGAAGRALLAVPGGPAVWVPRAAVIEQGGLTLVAVRDRGGAVRTIAVSLGGAGADGRVEVLSGLAGGEAVLLGLAAAPPAGAVLEEPPG